ncbi:MAG: hypothetical protein COS98_01630 [Parcubacteria group bacterium CG07_land_8_20_14_0_80_35_11]|nr:MAG: hypothetical protein COS98_01630 [Parcubacteria group bacterium CG07_land_8_20_14_0_80_35_11]
MEKEEFRKFLAEQISLPREKWDKRFKDYIEEKWQEETKISGEIPKPFPHETKEKDLKRYLEKLDLTKGQLERKRILDLGCGDGNFVKECLDKKITEDVFGFDYRIEPEAVPSEYRGHLIRADFEEEFPMKTFDLIVSFASLEAPSFIGEKKNPKKSLLFALEALKEDGEIRIFPVRKAPPQSGLLGVEYSKKIWQEILRELKDEKGIKWESRPINIRVAGKNKDVWLEELLIIKKK